MRQMKRRKVRNEKGETLIFYSTRRSAFLSLFQFVISALAPMFSLGDLRVLHPLGVGSVFIAPLDPSIARLVTT